MAAHRERVDEIVADKATAEALKPYYNVNCKRPTFTMNIFNRSTGRNVTLVDTAGKGVESGSAEGVVVDGKLFEVDCIIFATGFEVFSPNLCDGRIHRNRWRRTVVAR